MTPQKMYTEDPDLFWAVVEQTFAEDSFTEDDIRDYFDFVTDDDLIEILKYVRP